MSLILGPRLAVKMGEEYPILLGDNKRFQTVTNVESLMDEAVVLDKTTVLPNYKLVASQCF